MKTTDFFAEFRRHTQNAGYTGYRVTKHETRPEIEAFPSDRAVTQIPLSRVTRVTDEIRPPAGGSPVTRVTQALPGAGYNFDRKILAENQGQSVSVTPVTRVTRENDDSGEIHSIAPSCPACNGTDLRVSPAGGLVCGACGRFLFLHIEPDATAYASTPLRRCGALVCSDCRIHSPSPHRETCRVPRLEPCGSRWFWLSPFRAVKCVACASPTDLSLVEAWVLAPLDAGEGDDGWRIPGEILSLLHVETPMQ
jgi:hypothetical protein